MQDEYTPQSGCGLSDRAPNLTSQECSVLRRVAAGLTNRQISRYLGISEKTVKNHLSAIFRKIGVASRTQAAVYVLQSLGDGEQDEYSPQNGCGLSDWARNLSSREHSVLRLVAAGLTNRQISRYLGISEKTVKNHLSAIFRKIGVASRTQAAVYAMRIASLNQNELLESGS
jgi:DNA-binding NarL/FixJ family response regulator